MIVIGEQVVSFLEPARLLANHRAELLTGFERVLDEGEAGPGGEAGSLEREFASRFGSPHALTLSSGFAALHLALLAVGAGRGDEVILPSNGPVAAAEAVAATGARPVFADVEATGFALDPRDVERRVTPNTKAVIAVHLYGEMANMPELQRVTRAAGAALIEDASAAVGAVLNGAAAGTIGDIGCFNLADSIGSEKLTGALLVTANGAFAERVAMLRNNGGDEHGAYQEPAFDYRMTEFQAAALRVVLPHFAEWTDARQAAAALYDAELSRSPLTLPGGGVYQRYVIRTRYRSALQEYLAEERIEAVVSPAVPLHLQPAYAEGAKPGDLPNTEALSREMLSLPMHPLITQDEILAVARAVRQFGKFSAAMMREAAGAA